MVGNITFLMIFAVFDPSPLTLWINCSFSINNNSKHDSVYSAIIMSYAIIVSPPKLLIARVHPVYLMDAD